MPDDTTHGPNGGANPRSLCYPTRQSTTHIATALITNATHYKIGADEKCTTLGFCEFPIYLKLCAYRLNERILESTCRSGTPIDAGYTTVIRCALMSGLNQLSTDKYVLEFLALKKRTYLVDTSGMMMNEVHRINSKWDYPIPAPSDREPKTWRLKLTPSTHGRIAKLADDLGLSVSTFATTAVIFGLYDQPEITHRPGDRYTHAATISETVHYFDGLIQIRMETTRILLQLMENQAHRQASFAKPATTRTVDLTN